MSDKSQPIELKMAVTTAPLLMKISHKNEFIPKSIFFLAPSAKDSMNNWEGCLKMKAAAVFLAIFEQQTNSATLDAAEDLLNVIAQQCYDQIFPGGWSVMVFFFPQKKYISISWKCRVLRYLSIRHILRSGVVFCYAYFHNLFFYLIARCRKRKERFDARIYVIFVW